MQVLTQKHLLGTKNANLQVLLTGLHVRYLPLCQEISAPNNLDGDMVIGDDVQNTCVTHNDKECILKVLCYLNP